MATLRMRPGVLSSALSGAAATVRTIQIPGVGFITYTDNGNTVQVPGGGFITFG